MIPPVVSTASCRLCGTCGHWNGDGAIYHLRARCTGRGMVERTGAFERCGAWVLRGTPASVPVAPDMHGEVEVECHG